jgi:hypothetical protein
MNLANSAHIGISKNLMSIGENTVDATFVPDVA